MANKHAKTPQKEVQAKPKHSVLVIDGGGKGRFVKHTDPDYEEYGSGQFSATPTTNSGRR